MKSLNFSDDGPGITLNEYNEQFILVIDLTSISQADTEIYYPELVGAGIRVQLYFTNPLVRTTEVILLGEKLSTIFINKDGKVLKDG